MNTALYFAQTISVILTVCSNGPYIYTILKGLATPSRSSWIIWAILDGITLSGMVAKGVTNSQIVSGFLMTTLIAAATVKMTRAKPWGFREKLYLSAGLTGIILWALTSDPLWAIVISLGVIELALVSTLDSTWKQPWGEPPLLWFLSGLSSVPILATLPEYSLASSLQPIIWMSNNLVVIGIIFYRRRTVPRPRLLT